MADEIKNYENIDIPYNTYLSRGEITTPESSLDSSNGTKEEEIKSGDSLNDLWIRNFIRSENWSPKKKGFYLNGLAGYAEFSNVSISGNITALTGAIGGFTIGATSLSVTSGLNTTTVSSGSTAFSAGLTATPSVTITQAGVITATGVVITGSIGTTAGSVINGTYIDSLVANKITAGTGIINSLSVLSTLTMGSASTDGTIQSYGWNGTANGFQILGGTSPSVTIIGGTITGGTIQTATSGLRLVMSGVNNAYEFRSGSTLLSKLASMTIPDSGLSGAAIIHGTGNILLGVSGQGIGGGGRSIVMQNSTASYYFGFFDYDNGTFGVECNTALSAASISVTGSISASNFSGSSSGTNTGDSSGHSGLAALSGATFTGSISASNLSGTNTGDSSGHSGLAALSGAAFSGAVSASTLSSSGATLSLYRNAGGNITGSFSSTGLTVYGTNGIYLIDSNILDFKNWRLTMDSDKVAIVKTSQGFNALYCTESPEVWFMDFCKNKNELDPLFEEVTVAPYHYIKCEDGEYQVWGKRRGHSEKRFGKKSYDEFIANERFLNMNKPRYNI